MRMAEDVYCGTSLHTCSTKRLGLIVDDLIYSDERGSYLPTELTTEYWRVHDMIQPLSPRYACFSQQGEVRKYFAYRSLASV
jgi:hypothetical protein